MLESRKLNKIYSFTIIVGRFYRNKHFMAIADHKLGKHYFNVLAEANKMVVSAMLHFCLCWPELKQSVVDKAIDQ